jgi:putative DNA primase/helicase
MSSQFIEQSAADGAQFLDSKISRDANSLKAVHDDSRKIDWDWPEPQPLTAKIEPESYPVESLPDSVRAAIDEVHGFVKAPVPMVAASAISALSLAIQAHYDVERASALHSPTGLFMLTIADSGERKSTCDRFFTKAIIDYEDAQAEAAKPAINNYNADMASWEAKRSGIKDKIRSDAKSGKPTASQEANLRELEHDEPEPPRIPRLLYADATPEALAYNLAKAWPSGGVVSAEAGIVFGSHGMSKDSVMRNLATLNQLWDGTSLKIDRKTSESFAVRGARLTVALQVQTETLNSFFEKSGALARGTGFLARFLVSWPESTQGYRPFTEAPDSWPKLAAFNRRITEILNIPAPINEDGALTPQILTLTPEAKAAWIEFHDGIEMQLSSGGILFNVRDVASKIADNATRLAALFHVFEGGVGAISFDAFERASTIVAWHLNESRRFFGEIALPVEMADAVRLNDWLIKHCRLNKTHYIAKRFAQQYGTVRDAIRLDAAITELESLDRIQIRRDGKKISIWLNPKLLNQVTT